MKEKCCYVALDFDKEKAAALSVSLVQKHQLPDGREVEFGPEQFLCMEALFQPDFIGKNSLGAHMIALRSISSCSPDLQRPLFRNVLLSGGTGSSPSLRARMQRELSALVSPTTNVKVLPAAAGLPQAWGRRFRKPLRCQVLARRVGHSTQGGTPELTFQWGTDGQSKSTYPDP
ncbi:LOW QUALITY PROTEIN: hypothetical protein QTO34_003136 [Cnephaeus nilssonii]|uniref:Uncharacterized protein n=1 Tax=Cnephaeus nilssonii TaxID=3371016 RepID=A0AA40HQ73_CNENI|nr:LOW QUALITY PROTEIN: hypothetical protein QTO34_003136 [Eptesicus nilssonii]